MNTRLWVAAPVLVIGGAIAGAMAFGFVGPAASAAQPQVQGQDTSTLDDQTELALTVYNSDLALVRDVRNVQLPRGTFDLRFMDIAATVNPATVHFRSLTEPSRVDVLEQNYEYDLLEPDKLLRKYVGRDVTLVRLGAERRHHAAGRSEGSSSELQQRAGLADRQRDRHRPARRSHPLPGAARQPLLAPDADLVARERRRRAPPDRGVVSRHQARLERRLRPHRRARRQARRRGRLGHADQRQRHRVQEREAAARGRAS